MGRGKSLVDVLLCYLMSRNYFYLKSLSTFAGKARSGVYQSAAERFSSRLGLNLYPLSRNEGGKVNNICTHPHIYMHTYTHQYVILQSCSDWHTHNHVHTQKTRFFKGNIHNIYMIAQTYHIHTPATNTCNKHLHQQMDSLNKFLLSESDV